MAFRQLSLPNTAAIPDVGRSSPNAEKLQAAITGAIQLVAVQDRAAAAGIGPDRLHALLTPARVETGVVESDNRSGDERDLAALSHSKRRTVWPAH